MPTRFDPERLNSARQDVESSVFLEGHILHLSQGARPQCLPKFLEPPTMHTPLGMTNSRKILWHVHRRGYRLGEDIIVVWWQKKTTFCLNYINIVILHWLTAHERICVRGWLWECRRIIDRRWEAGTRHTQITPDIKEQYLKVILPNCSVYDVIGVICADFRMIRSNRLVICYLSFCLSELKSFACFDVLVVFVVDV